MSFGLTPSEWNRQRAEGAWLPIGAHVQHVIVEGATGTIVALKEDLGQRYFKIEWHDDYGLCQYIRTRYVRRVSPLEVLANL